MHALGRLLVSGVVVATAVVVLRPDGAAQTAVPAATFVDGDFTHSNSRDGMPVLEHPNLAPGQEAEGTVTIVNTGTLGGDFALSVDDLFDAAGPVGGPLSERLRLRVRDLQGQASGYDGALTTLDSLPLGYFSPGEAHTYAIALGFPHGTSDNAYAASSTGMRFVWDAVQGDPPSEPHSPPDDGQRGPSVPAPPAAGGSPRERPLHLTVHAPHVQRFMWRKRVLVRARCNRPCRIATRGTVRVGSRTAPLRTRLTHTLHAGVVRPRVRLPRGLRRDARRWLDQQRAVVYRLKISARDRAGQRVVVTRRVTVRKRGDGRSARVVTSPIGVAR